MLVSKIWSVAKQRPVVFDVAHQEHPLNDEHSPQLEIEAQKSLQKNP